jgi:hypothetical protein
MCTPILLHVPPPLFIQSTRSLARSIPCAHAPVVIRSILAHPLPVVDRSSHRLLIASSSCHLKKLRRIFNQMWRYHKSLAFPSSPLSNRVSWKRTKVQHNSTRGRPLDIANRLRLSECELRFGGLGWCCWVVRICGLELREGGERTAEHGWCVCGGRVGGWVRC